MISEGVGGGGTTLECDRSVCTVQCPHQGAKDHVHQGSPIICHMYITFACHCCQKYEGPHVLLLLYLLTFMLASEPQLLL